MLMTDMKENETEDERLERIVRKVVQKELLKQNGEIEETILKLLCGFIGLWIFWHTYWEKPIFDHWLIDLFVSAMWAYFGSLLAVGVISMSYLLAGLAINSLDYWNGR